MPSLLKLQKHKILGQVNARSINPNIFSVFSDDEQFSLTYQNLSFTFYLLKDSYNDCYISYTTFNPSFATIEHPDERFDNALSIFASWLDDDLRPYLAEQSLEDPWTKFGEEFNADSFRAEFKSDDQFAPAEIAQGETKLNLLACELDATEAPDDVKQVLKQLANDVREIKEDLKRMNKKKWWWQATGLLFRIWEFGQAFLPDGGQDIKQIINDLFSKFERPLIS